MSGQRRPHLLAFVIVGAMSVSGAFLVALKFLHKTHAQEAQAIESEVNAAEAAAANAPVAVIPGGAKGDPENPQPVGARGQPPVARPPGPSQQPPVPGNPAAKGAPATEPPKTANSELSELEGFLEPFIYDVVNRRDPFMAWAEFVMTDVAAPSRPLSPAQRFDLDQLRLVGIMWDIKDPKAMFMDPEQDVIVLGRDEGIGNRNGYIASIREGEVVVVEAIRKRGDVIYKTRVLRIER